MIPEHYGWHSPEQTAERFAQRVELAVERRTRVVLPRPVVGMVRGVARTGLRGAVLLADLDRRAADLVSGQTRR